MNVIDWFDPDNIKHLKAYNHLKDTGFWPEGFLPEDIEFTPAWGIKLQSRIVNVYLKEKLGE